MPDRDAILDKWATRLAWMEQHVRIIDKAGRLVPYRPNAQQLTMYRLMIDQECAGEPIRVQVLKARREGVSTGVAALFYAIIAEQENWRGLVSAHDSPSSDILFEMVRVMEAEDSHRRPTRNSSKKELIWEPPGRGYYHVQTAGKDKLGRGWQLNLLHMSEVAFWPHATTTQNSVMQAAESAYIVVKESTANGVGGQFYDDWKAAVEARENHPDDLAGFSPLFLSWLEFPEYRRAVPEGYDWGELSVAETELRGRGADDEQLYWRRRKIADDCGHSPELFCQEYPSTPEEAFISTGAPALPRELIERHRRMCEPGRVARLVFTPAYGRLHDVPRDTRDQVVVRALYNEAFSGPAWLVWREPDPEHDYAIGGDVMRGEVSDPNDERSDRDWSTAFVMDRQTLEQVARFRSRLPTDEFGEQLLLASLWYNGAWVSPEANDAGIAAINILKNWPYQRIYRREASDLDTDVREVTRLGWLTSGGAGGTRELLWDDWVAANILRLGSDEGKLITVHDIDLVLEEEQAVRDSQGRRGHRPGAHDDLLFAAMIALQVHRRCSRTRPVFVDRSRRNPKFAGPGYVGGRDTWRP